MSAPRQGFRRLRWRSAPLLTVTLLLGACAGSDTRSGGAPIEDRAGDKTVAAPSSPPPPQAAAVTSGPSGTNAEVTGQVTGEVVTRTLPLPDAPALQLALAPKPRPPAAHPATLPLRAAAARAAERGDWERAQAALERALKLDPRDHALWRELAYTHFRQGDLDQAIGFAERALKLAEGQKIDPRSSLNLIADIESARGNPAASQRARRRASGLE